MQILLHSHSFFPLVGGVETISMTLAQCIVKSGHKLTVVTETRSQAEDVFDFPVVRNPSFHKLLQLTRKVDIVHSNGASMRMVPFALLARKPFLWTHNGYQVSCIDGLGWDESGPTPTTPFQSFTYHLKKNGLVAATRGYIALVIRRFVAFNIAYNAAATRWIDMRQPLPRQEILYTPYPLDKFKIASNKPNDQFDFVFVGRLVNEKGVEVLIKALALLRERVQGTCPTLLIVGDGPLRGELQSLVQELSLDRSISFAGVLRGEALLQAMQSAPVGVVPSVYEEPMGGVALELLASGRSVIVSRKGGMTECVGQGGVTFENGNSLDLANKMASMLEKSPEHLACVDAAQSQLAKFSEDELALRYLDHYNTILRKPRLS